MRKTKLTAIDKDLIKALSKEGYSVSLSGDSVNIARSDGVHCEFYKCGEYEKGFILTATYTVEGRERDIDVSIPDETGLFIAYVKNILSV